MQTATLIKIEVLDSWQVSCQARHQRGLCSEIDASLCGRQAIVEFFVDRLKVQQREAGVRHDLIDAVFALGGEDDLVRLLARVRALQAFVGTEDGANLLAGYKRAANILKKEGYGNPMCVGGEEAGAEDGVSISLARTQRSSRR